MIERLLFRPVTLSRLFRRRLPRHLAWLPVLFFSIASWTGSMQAQEDEGEGTADAKVSYYMEIRPILQAACHGCHQPAKRGGDYVMTEFAAMLAGGETGEVAIIPGDAEHSYFMDLIIPVDGEAEMPKDSKPLTADEIALIARWINEGAINDTPAQATTIYDMDNPPVYTANPVITSVDYSADGRFLAVSGFHEVLIYNTSDYSLYARLVGLSERIESAVFSPDSKRLAVAGGSPGRKGEIQIWDVEKRQLELSVSEGFDTLYGASWSKDGQKVAFGCPDSNVRAIDSNTGEQILFNGAHDDWVLDTVFSLESDHLVTVGRDRSMKLVHVETQRFIDNITSITPGALKGGLNAVDRHPTADQLLAGGADGAPKLYRMIRDKARKIGDDFNLIRAYPALTGRVYDVRFSTDGTKLVACSSFNGAGLVRVYQTDNAAQLVSIDVPQGGVFSVDFTSDGAHLVAGGFDGITRVYQADNGELVHEFSPLDRLSTTTE